LFESNRPLIPHAACQNTGYRASHHKSTYCGTFCRRFEVQFDVASRQEAMRSFDQGAVGRNVDERGIVTRPNADHNDPVLGRQPGAFRETTIG
jgi:hypothetical protein